MVLICMYLFNEKFLYTGILASVFIAVWSRTAQLGLAYVFPCHESSSEINLL